MPSGFCCCLCYFFLNPTNILCLWKGGFGDLRGNHCCLSLSANAEVWKEDNLERQGGNLILGQICGIHLFRLLSCMV